VSRPPVLARGVDPELTALLRRVKLGRLLDTLPERLTLARALPAAAAPHRRPMTTDPAANPAAHIVTPPPGGSAPCPTHPHCLLLRCHRFRCPRPIHVRLRGPGRPRQFCSVACRVAEHRKNRGC
jgi:hypothetical protein